jgi:hypothetical protein
MVVGGVLRLKPSVVGPVGVMTGPDVVTKYAVAARGGACRGGPASGG